MEFGFSGNATIPPVKLGIGTALHEKRIFPAAGRCLSGSEEQENGRDAGRPAAGYGKMACRACSGRRGLASLDHRDQFSPPPAQGRRPKNGNSVRPVQGCGRVGSDASPLEIALPATDVALFGLMISRGFMHAANSHALSLRSWIALIWMKP